MNNGKIFEEDFKKSIPKDIFVFRLKDSAQSFLRNGNLNFSWNNPCDFFVFNSKKLFCFELKSTQQKYITYDGISNDKMIKAHQVNDLIKLSKFKNVICGLLLNFRGENGIEDRTYFMEINKFNEMFNNINKKSLNEIDLIRFGSIKVKGHIKKTRYYWNIKDLIDELEK